MLHKDLHKSLCPCSNWSVRWFSWSSTEVAHCCFSPEEWNETGLLDPKKIAKEVKEHSSHSSHLGQKTSYDTIAYALASVNMGQTDQSPATTCTTLFFEDSCLQGRYGFVPPSNFDSRAVGVMGRSWDFLRDPLLPWKQETFHPLHMEGVWWFYPSPTRVGERGHQKKCEKWNGANCR